MYSHLLSTKNFKLKFLMNLSKKKQKFFINILSLVKALQVLFLSIYLLIMKEFLE